MVCLVAFLRLARRWPRLMRNWSKVDLLMDRKYGKPLDLNRKLRLITVVLMTLAASKYCRVLRNYFICALLMVFFSVEHALALVSHLAHCRFAYGDVDVSLYHRKCFPNFFASENYNIFLGVAIQVVLILH